MPVVNEMSAGVYDPLQQAGVAENAAAEAEVTAALQEPAALQPSNPAQHTPATMPADVIRTALKDALEGKDLSPHSTQHTTQRPNARHTTHNAKQPTTHNAQTETVKCLLSGKGFHAG